MKKVRIKEKLEKLRSEMAAVPQDAHAGPNIRDYMVGRWKPDGCDQDRRARARDITYLPHALMGRGVAGCKGGGAVHHDADGVWRPPAMVCMPAMRGGLQGAVWQRSISVPALLGPWLPVPARVDLEPNVEPHA